MIYCNSNLFYCQTVFNKNKLQNRLRLQFFVMNELVAQNQIKFNNQQYLNSIYFLLSKTMEVKTELSNLKLNYFLIK